MYRVFKERCMDAIILYAYDRSPEVRNILYEITTFYESIMKGNLVYDTASNREYINILKILMDNPDMINTSGGIAQLVLQLKTGCIGLSSIEFEKIQIILNDSLNKSVAQARRAAQLKEKVQKWITWLNCDAYLRKMFMVKEKIANNPNDVDAQEILFNDLLTKNRELTDIMTAVGNQSHLDTIDMRQPNSLVEAIRKFRCKRKQGVFQLGWQGLNRMLGENHGVMMGETMLTAALSHHYKSGLLTKLARWICQYNNPPADISGLRPTVLLISLENEIYENLMQIYIDLKVCNNEVPDLNSPDDDIANYITTELGRRGWLFVMERADDNFTWQDFLTLQQKYHNSGCRVCATIIDYFIPMSLDGIDASSNDAIRRQKLMHKFATFAEREQQFIATSMQLGAEADMVAGSGRVNIVKQFRMSMLGDCKGARRETGIMIYHHIEKNQNGDAYLTMLLDKHRYSPELPEVERYCAMKFISLDEGVAAKAGILDDILGDDKSVDNIYTELPTEHIQANIPNEHQKLNNIFS